MCGTVIELYNTTNLLTSAVKFSFSGLFCSKAEVFYCLSNYCWFSFCCFFSLIWNISKINVLRQNLNYNTQMNFVKIFLKYNFFGSTIVYVFITEIYVYKIHNYLQNYWHTNWQSIIDALETSAKTFSKFKLFQVKKYLLFCYCKSSWLHLMWFLLF